MTSSDSTWSRVGIEGSDGAKAAGRDYHEGITFEEHRAALADGEAKLRELLGEKQAERDRAHAAEKAALQTEVRLLREQLDEYRRRLANPEQSYRELQGRVAELEKLLADMPHGIGENRLRSAHAALERGDFSEAAAIFAGVKARAKAHAAEAAHGEGLIAEQQVRWGEAAERFAEAAALAPNYERLFKAREHLWRAGRHARALALGPDLIAAAIAEHGEGSAEHAAALNAHAQTLDAIGRYPQAEPLFRQAMEITGKALGTDHPAYAAGLNNLAELLRATGRDEEAEPLYRQAIEITGAVLGTDHPDYAISLNNLALLLQATGRHGEAEPLHRQAIEIGGAALGTDHPAYATRLNNLAELLRATGRHEEAEPLYRQAMEIWGAALGTDHPDYANSLNNLALLLERTERAGEARGLYAQALGVVRAALGAEHPHTRHVAGNYADLLRGRFPDDPALAALEAEFGAGIGRA